jgi:hypothetical protein
MGLRHHQRRCDRRCDRHWCYQNRQNKVSFGFHVYILQTVPTYLPLDRCIRTDFGNIVCDGRYQRISSSSTMMLLFFLLFGVRPNRYLTYRTNIYVDRRSCFLYFQSTDAQTSAATFYFMLRILDDLATCATHTNLLLFAPAVAPKIFLKNLFAPHLRARHNTWYNGGVLSLLRKQEEAKGSNRDASVCRGEDRAEEASLPPFSI